MPVQIMYPEEPVQPARSHQGESWVALDASNAPREPLENVHQEVPPEVHQRHAPPAAAHHHLVLVVRQREGHERVTLEFHVHDRPPLGSGVIEADLEGDVL